MRHLMILGLMAVAAAAMAVLAASASATTVTSPTGTVATPTIHAVNEGGHLVLHNPQANIECNSTIEGKVESHGEGVTAKGKITSLSFTSCTNGWEVSVQANGELEAHWTSGYNGKLTSNGATVTATLNLGKAGHITCRYKTNATQLGTITGGNPATIHLEAQIPFHSGSGACGNETSNWTGNLVTTGPLHIDGGSPPPPPAVTSPTGTAATAPVHLVNQGGHVLLHNPNSNIECNSTIETSLSTSDVGTAFGPVSALTFTGCTNGWTVTVDSPGELQIHHTGAYNGTVTSTGMTITATLNLGIFGHITCRYKTSATDIGTITGGNPATLHIAAQVPFHSGSDLCGGSTSNLTGNLVTTDALYIDPSPPPAVTSPTGTAAAAPIHLVNENDHVTLHNPQANIACSSTIKTTLSTSDVGTAIGPVSALTFTGCTNGWTVTVDSPGELQIHHTGAYNGTVTSTGMTVTATLNLGIFGHVTCRYKTNSTDIGTITGGNPATLDIKAQIPFHSGSGICGAAASNWTGNLATIGALYIDK